MVYRLVSAKITGDILVEYLNGHVSMVQITTPLTIQQFRYLMNNIPMTEDAINSGKLDFIVHHVTHLQIGLFCRLYAQVKGIKYKVSASDAGKMKTIKVDEATILHYLRSENFLFKGKHSISNLVKYYNELMAEITAGPKTSSHPNYYDQKYEQSLQAGARSDYWKHLRSLGLTPVKNHTNAIVGWK
jgi:hypothetical protein